MIPPAHMLSNNCHTGPALLKDARGRVRTDWYCGVAGTGLPIQQAGANERDLRISGLGKGASR